LSNSDWQNTTSGAYAIYNNDPVNDGLYGKLYNHYAVTDSRGLCPTGWHVPSDTDWTILGNQFGGSALAGSALKSTLSQPNPGGWPLPNSSASNSSGFTAIPGGLIGNNGLYYSGNSDGYWWTTTFGYLWGGLSRVILENGTGLLPNHTYNSFGMSVRCLKNTLPQVNTTSVTNVTPSSALVTGEVISQGDQSTTRGFCYSTASNPTILNDTTVNGTGIGIYSGTLMNLTPSTTYYIRAYATNSLGTSYGSELNFTSSSITIGSNYAGGIVFYLDSTGQHGLVCAPSNQGTLIWGCYGTDIVGTSTAFGTGQANTNLILSGCSTRPIAASVCDDLLFNGYSDWYLPSRDEMLLMLSNLHTQGIGGFLNTEYYSSSQYSPTDAWVVHFGDGRMLDHYRLHNFQIRAVRAF